MSSSSPWKSITPLTSGGCDLRLKKTGLYKWVGVLCSHISEPFFVDVRRRRPYLIHFISPVCAFVKAMEWAQSNSRDPASPSLSSVSGLQFSQRSQVAVNTANNVKPQCMRFEVCTVVKLVKSLKTEFLLIIIYEFRSYLTGNTLHLLYKNHPINAFRESVAVYCENYMKHTNTHCGQNAEF
jgi:hypothetical protein